METKPTSQNEQQANRRYLTVWRWHFYAGLLVAPFLTLLAVTGLGMLLFANITGKEGERIPGSGSAFVGSGRSCQTVCESGNCLCGAIYCAARR